MAGFIKSPSDSSIAISAIISWSTDISRSISASGRVSASGRNRMMGILSIMITGLEWKPTQAATAGRQGCRDASNSGGTFFTAPGCCVTSIQQGRKFRNRVKESKPMRKRGERRIRTFSATGVLSAASSSKNLRRACARQASSMMSLRQLKRRCCACASTDLARLIHQRLCGWIDPGKSGRMKPAPKR